MNNISAIVGAGFCAWPRQSRGSVSTHYLKFIFLHLKNILYLLEFKEKKKFEKNRFIFTAPSKNVFSKEFLVSIEKYKIKSQIMS
jgi:hypothetical protein